MFRGYSGDRYVGFDLAANPNLRRRVDRASHVGPSPVGREHVEQGCPRSTRSRGCENGKSHPTPGPRVIGDETESTGIGVGARGQTLAPVARQSRSAPGFRSGLIRRHVGDGPHGEARRPSVTHRPAVTTDACRRRVVRHRAQTKRARRGAGALAKHRREVTLAGAADVKRDVDDAAIGARQQLHRASKPATHDIVTLRGDSRSTAIRSRSLSSGRMARR